MRVFLSVSFEVNGFHPLTVYDAVLSHASSDVSGVVLTGDCVVFHVLEEVIFLILSGNLHSPH